MFKGIERPVKNQRILPKYTITKDNTTIHIQGGINAVNGISEVFMVKSVMAVAKVGGLRRERKNSNEFVRKNNEKSEAFAKIINSEVQDDGEVEREYASTVYGRDMKLSSMQYRTREYHY